LDMVKKGNMMDKEDIIDILAIDLLGVVPEDEKIIISTNEGNPIVFVDDSKSSAAFKRIARRIEGETVPIFGEGEQEGIVTRLRKIFVRNNRKEPENV
jgi:septum site-determining protein MinD